MANLSSSDKENTAPNWRKVFKYEPLPKQVESFESDHLLAAAPIPQAIGGIGVEKILREAEKDPSAQDDT